MLIQTATELDHQTAAAVGYRAVFSSQNGTWLIGTYPVLFGVRVVAWRSGSMTRCVDYCVGASRPDLITLLALIRQIFELHLPEDATEEQVTCLLPGWSWRPVQTDPACWKRLHELAMSPIEVKEA